MKKLLLSTIILLVSVFACFGQIQIKNADAVLNPIADSLVRTLAGFGVQISNVSSNLNPSNKYQGTFRSLDPLFPISRGLVMGSGIVDSLRGRNRLTTLSTNINYLDTISGTSIGRQLLKQVIASQWNSTSQVPPVTDVSTIKFDLVPIGDSVNFKYIFASEEYPEFVCSRFNDVFGFFIKGPGIVGDSMFNGTSMAGYKNIAKISGTNLPVTINTVNPGVAGSSGQTINCNFTPEGIAKYVTNNDQGDPLYNTLAMDGLTKVMNAGAKVIPCEDYTLVLAIADAGDRIFDSGVFLEMGSMVSGEYCTFIPFSPTGLGDTISSTHPGKLMFKRCASALNEKWVIRYKIEGSALPNVDYKRLMPNGTITSIPDSIILLPGQRNDSIMLVAVGNSFATKSIAFRFLNIKNPYAFGQPNYASRIDLKIRAIPTKLATDITSCWFDTSNVAYSGPALSDLTYQWNEIVNGQLQSSNLLSCSDCRSPNIILDTLNHTFQVRIANSVGGVSYNDTLKVFGKKFVNSRFSVINNSIFVNNVQTGYQYFWKVNNQPVGSPSTTQVTFQSGDQIFVEVVSPNGCKSRYSNNQIFTSVDNFKFSRKEVNIFPNPVQNQLHIEVGNDGKYDLTVEDITGRKLLELQFRNQTSLDVNSLKAGTYFVSVKDQNQKTVSRNKIFIQK
jgi:hypothetical protein